MKQGAALICGVKGQDWLLKRELSSSRPADLCDGFSSEVVSIPSLGVFKQGPVAVAQVGQRGSFSGV